MDDQHTAALALEASIKSLMAKRKAAMLLDEAREELGKGAVTGAQGLLQHARSLDPDANVKRLERDLRLARVEQQHVRQRAEAVRQALEAADQALVRGEVESAAAFARQALELAPDSERGRALEAEAIRRLEEETSGIRVAATDVSSVRSPRPAARAVDAAALAAATMIAPAGNEAPPVIARPAMTKTPGPDNPASLRGAVAPQAIAKARAGGRQKILAAAAAAVVVSLVVVGVVTMGPPAGSATGAVVIDAIPFASVTAIEAKDGSRHALPPDASTPLALTLPVGTYRIHLVGPAPANESRLVTVQVHADGMATSPAEQFGALTPEQYFESYLSPPVAAPDSVEQLGTASAGTAHGSVASSQGTGR